MQRKLEKNNGCNLPIKQFSDDLNLILLAKIAKGVVKKQHISANIQSTRKWQVIGMLLYWDEDELLMWGITGR